MIFIDMITPYQIITFTSHANSLYGWLAVHTKYTDEDTVDKIETIGHTFMQKESNKKIKFFDSWVHPDHRRQGIFRSLWDTRWEYVQSTFSDYKVYAWCLPKSLPLLIEKGFSQGDLCTYVEKNVYEESSPTDKGTTI